MASPIEDFRIRKDGNSRINLSFEYAGVAESFDSVMALLVEQDGIGDNWEIKPREIKIHTDSGWMVSTELDFYNKTHNRWWNQGSPGSIDDSGNRRRVRRLPLPLGLNPVSFGIMFFAGQIDENHTSTVPGLEFYAVAAIVATVNGKPVAQLGDLKYSNQLAGV